MNNNSATRRWWILGAATVIMMIISIYQYSWSLFAFAITEELQWDLSAVGLTFTVFAYCATFIQPIAGFVADRYGPRKVAVLAAALAGAGFVLCATASTPLLLYVYYGMGGLGVGILYGIATACMVKWFPDRRGLAVGIVVFGFGAGTALFNTLIQRALAEIGLTHTFVVLGALMAATVVPLSVFLRFPAVPRQASTGKGAVSERVPDAPGRSRAFSPRQMLSTHQWYLIYFSFIATVSIVLMFGAQMKMMAKDLAIPKSYLGAVLVLFPLGNGLSRVISGAVSDRIGRERTMVLFYTLLAASIFGFVFLGHVPVLFVGLVFVCALFGGAPFALYPATIGDYYGTRYSATNYGITYTAKAWAGLISGWLSGYLFVRFGSYRVALIVIGACSVVAAVLSSRRVLKAPAGPREDRR